MFNAGNYSDTSPDQPPSKNQKLSEDLKEFDFVAQVTVLLIDFT